LNVIATAIIAIFVYFDCINRPKDIVDRAIEIGLSGVCLTDHECLSGQVEVDRIQQELIEQGSSFKFCHGNEIYLVDERTSGQKYWHFILIAKDKIGFKAMRELSSTAWMNSYYDRGLERVPTLKSELEAIIKKYGKGHVISSSACLGSELDYEILEMNKAEKNGDIKSKKEHYQNIVKFVTWCKELFGDDYYMEVQPARSEEQIIVNKRMIAIAKYFNVKIIVTTDAHYLRKEDREIHKAYLNSKEAEREVDSFYEFCYLQTEEEIIKNLEGTGLDYYELEANTQEIYDKIEVFSIQRPQQVPQVDVKDYLKKESHLGYKNLDRMYQSDNKQERYWVNQCVDKLKEWNLDNEVYLSRLEEEADIKRTVGERLHTCMFAYPIFLQHYINLFWECGSMTGVGRGSAGSGLNHWLLGITSVDPVKNNLPFWRYMNHDTKELGDLDLDLNPSKRELIFQKIREEQNSELACVQVCTFTTEGTRSAILTAARGYRSRDCPEGIDNDTAQYMASLIPQERGFLWPIKDVINGNEEKGRKPVKKFIQEVNKYPGLLDIIAHIEGLIRSRGIHPSGVNFYSEDPYETACFMKATNGAIVTQYSLHDTEWSGDVKVDLLVTQQMDIMTQCINMLQEHGYFEKGLSLRETYNKYVVPNVLPLNEDKLWDTIDKGEILALFQLTSQTGNAIVKKLKPRNVEELTACNALMRLMPEGLKMI
jgi:DNA polymerase-3 subunit alpha